VRKPRDRRVLLVLDEFAAVSQSAGAAVDLVERAAGYGAAFCLSTQAYEGLGARAEARRIVNSVGTVLLHRVPNPEELIALAGTRRVPDTSLTYEPGAGSPARTTTRLREQSAVDPNEVRRLVPGTAFALGDGRAMKLQVDPAPGL
jgi:hypothetical protein